VRTCIYISYKIGLEIILWGDLQKLLLVESADIYVHVALSALTLTQKSETKQQFKNYITEPPKYENA
jgi:hypothetical protein